MSPRASAGRFRRGNVPPHRVTLLPGDGIGPEIAEATVRVLEATGAELEWDRCEVGFAAFERTGSALPPDVLDSIRERGVALKGPVSTLTGNGARSVNAALRRGLGVLADIRPSRSFAGVPSAAPRIDIVTVRIEPEELDETGIERAARLTFEYARRHGRRRLTAVHEGNAMRPAGGHFLATVRGVGESGYPDIELDEATVDGFCRRLLSCPEECDVALAPSLHGRILSEIGTTLSGGLGMAPEAHVGDDCVVFETVHGTAPKYAGENRANPLALILCGEMMLRHLGEVDAADRLLAAIADLLLEAETVTFDLKLWRADPTAASTFEVAEALVEKLGAPVPAA